jgi:hypothetical protein
VGFVSVRPALAIAGAIVGGFIVSFALMWRVQVPPAAAAAGPPSPPSVPEPRSMPTVGPSREAAYRVAAVRAVPVSVRPTPAPNVAEVAAETDAAGPMPIGINVYNRRARHRFEGYVANASNKPLSVTLEVVGAEGRGNSSLKIELPAGGRQDFNSESGLDMQTNDQIVVHSDYYEDVTVAVP